VVDRPFDELSRQLQGCFASASRDGDELYLELDGATIVFGRHGAQTRFRCH